VLPFGFQVGVYTVSPYRDKKLSVSLCFRCVRAFGDGILVAIFLRILGTVLVSCHFAV
jgi:hypothetical protein